MQPPWGDLCGQLCQLLLLGHILGKAVFLDKAKAGRWHPRPQSFFSEPYASAK